MNDRASSKPPTTYIGDEEFMERYDRENGDTRGRKMARPKTLMHHPNASTIGSSADRSEASRHSGIFRFGKSLAASFNPSNWKIFSKPPEEVEDAQQKILRERREKAEAMYQELKRTGQFPETTFGPTLFQPPGEKEEPLPTKHDSGVEFGRQRSTSRMSQMSGETSREDKRKGRIFLEPPQLPTGVESQFTHSPASTNQDSVRKSKFHFKKPSLSNIRNSISDIASDGSAGNDYHPARRVPSRKDLQKQQKLVKRVSDLEGKLEAARRQLAQAMEEPIPTGPPKVVRQRFVPGAMPSLPSERLLFAGRGNSDAGMSESVSVSQIGKAVTMDDPIMSGGRLNNEQPDFDESLPLEPDTPSEVRIMQSVEVDEEESLEMDEAPAELEQPVLQSVKSGQVEVIQHSGASQLSSNHASDPTDEEADSEYQVSESGKHETSPGPSEAPPFKARASRPAKRKSLADDSGVFKPCPGSESDISSVRAKRTLNKKPVSNPRKLQKTTATSTTTKTKTSAPPHEQRHRHRQLTKKSVTLAPSKVTKNTKLPSKGQKSASPPPSSHLTGMLDYNKPSSQQPGRHGSAVGAADARMATYSAVPGQEIPPMPEMPRAVRLASGEVLEIAAQKGKGKTTVKGKGLGDDERKGEGESAQQQPQRVGSKLTKFPPAAQTPREGRRGGETGWKEGELKREESFQWPDDVF